MSSRRKNVTAAVILAVIASCAFLTYQWIHVDELRTQVRPFVPNFRLDDHVSVMLATGDGQEIATIAEGRYTPHPGYRWRRLLPITLAWAVALGHPPWVPYAMLVLTVIGSAVLACACADWLEDLAPGWGWTAWLVSLLPGVLASLSWLGPEALGLGLAIIGWRRHDWRLLALAGLTRETLLVFAFQRRKVQPFVIYVGWTIVTIILWGRPGIPFETLGFMAVGDIHNPRVAAVLFVATMLVGLVALVASKNGERELAAWFVALALILGPSAWSTWRHFTRILLPLWVLGPIALVAAKRRRTSELGPELVHQLGDAP